MFIEDYLTKREWIFMTDKQNSENNTNNRIIEFLESHQIFSQFALPIITSVLASFIFSAVIAANSIPSRFSNMENDVTVLKESLGNIDLKSEFENLNARYEELDSSLIDIDKQLNTLEHRVDELDKRLWDVSLLKASEIIAPAISMQLQSFEQERFTVHQICHNNDIIATNLITQVSYTAEQFANQKMLLTYTENGEEIFFFGQYNENNLWDGECVINAYKNNQLVRITEGIYDNGRLLTYKQVFRDTLDQTGEVKWFISERVHHETYNTGKTWQLTYDKLEKKFESETASPMNIIWVDDFATHIQTKIEAFYFGNTSNGEYNDATGKAYYIGYADDGTIRTLYVGGFANGTFNDTTGKAWMIGRDVNKNTDYMYSVGNYINGKNVKELYFEHHLTPKRIEEIISHMKFECNMNWFNFTLS